MTRAYCLPGTRTVSPGSKVKLRLQISPTRTALQPVGDTSFVETFSAGSPTITTPGLSGTGLLQSGALESSNVEITSQLVRMIIAQRNFQANAQMIQTEDAVTQTVINLR